MATDATYSDEFSSSRNISYPTGASLAFSPYITALYLTIYAPLWFCIVFGNLLVILAFVYDRGLRHAKYYLLVSLSVTDLMTGCVALPCIIISRLVVSPLTCLASTRFFFFLPTLIFCLSSITHLIFIAIDRLLSLMFPLRYRHLYRPRRVLVAISFIWLYVTALCFFPIYGPSTGDNLWICHNDNNYGGDTDILYVAFAALLPCTFLLMMGMYVCMILIARSHIKRRLEMTSSRQTSDAEEAARMRLRGLKTMATVVGAFGICMLPVSFKFIHEVYLPASKQELIAVQTVAEYMAFMNSMVNPLIYGYFNEQFRTGFKKAIARWNCVNMSRGSTP